MNLRHRQVSTKVQTYLCKLQTPNSLLPLSQPWQLWDAFGADQGTPSSGQSPAGSPQPVTSCLRYTDQVLANKTDTVSQPKTYISHRRQIFFVKCATAADKVHTRSLLTGFFYYMFQMLKELL